MAALNMSGITKSGEGAAFKENELPLDIHYHKLVDWLVDRKQLQKAYQKPLQAVREKINTALKDMPDNEDVSNLLKGTHITYYHCLQIVDLLKKDEATGGTGLFGQYTNKHMKEWYDIVKSYEKDNLFLGEAGQVLTQNVNYEIPNLKKLVQKCQNQILDLNKRESEAGRTSAEFQRKFKAQCTELKIEGKDLRAEVKALVKELPEIYEAVVKLSRDERVARAVAYHRELIRYIHGDGALPGGEEDVFPLLNCLRDKGNEVLATLTGRSLPKPSEPAAAIGGGIDFGDGGGIDFGDGGAGGGIDFGDGGGIDFGDSGATGGAAGGIDFGDGAAAGGGIDFGDFGVDLGGASITAAAGGDAGGIDFGDGDGGIDWGDVGGAEPAAEDAGATIDWGFDTAAIEVAGEGMEAPDRTVLNELLHSAANHNLAETLLENRITRNAFIDDLLELQAFLQQRVVDVTSGEGSSVGMTQFEDAPAVVQEMDLASLEACVHHIGDMLDATASSRANQLIMIKSSAKYTDRIVNSLRQKLSNSEKLENSKQSIQQKREELESSIQTTTPAMSKLVNATKTLQGQVEASVSKLYQNRRVNIIGEINNLQV